SSGKYRHFSPIYYPTLPIEWPQTSRPSINPTMATKEKTVRILSGFEDWDVWYKDLQASHTRIWPYIDPEAQNAPALRDEPGQVQFRDFESRARTYAALSPENRTAYDNARKYYDADLKYYNQEQDLLQKVKNWIQE